MTPEGAVKETVCRWLTLQPGVEFWVTNSVGIFDAARKRFRKSKWSRPGQSDIWGFLPDGRPFWMELKSSKGRLTPVQKEFLEIVQSRGHLTAVVHSLDDARDALARWSAPVLGKQGEKT